MEKCWHSDPFKRPTIENLEYIISQWLRCINQYYELNKKNGGNIEDGNNDAKFLSFDMFQFKNDIFEFVKANNTLSQEKTDTSIIQFHSQAFYTSRSFTEISYQHSECLDCAIDN